MASVENSNSIRMQPHSSRISADQSLRISVLRFPLIAAVVFIHAYHMGEPSVPAGQSLDTARWISHFVREFVSQGIARTAVPIFFLIAGYLFYRNFNLSRAAYFSKIRSRTETLLIPFLFWNLFVFSIFAFAQSNPKTAGYFTGSVTKILDLHWTEYFPVLFGIGHDPIAYQFWFIRNLIVATAISPALFLAMKHLPKTTLVAALLIWFGFHYSPSAEGLFFFVLGATAAVHSVDMFSTDPYGKAMSLCYLPLAIADAALGDTYGPGLHMVAMSVGVVSVLYLSKFVAGRKMLARRLVGLAGVSFFVFAAHEPLLTICRKLVAKVMPNGDPITGLLYFAVIPVLLIFALIPLCGAINKLSPRFARTIGAGPQGA